MIFKRKLRYVLVEASREVNLADRRGVDDLKAKLHGAMGEAAYFRANLHVAAQLREDVFVISCNRGQERDLVLALSFIKELGGKRIGFYTIKISGTIRSLKDHFFRMYAQ